MKSDKEPMSPSTGLALSLLGVALAASACSREGGDAVNEETAQSAESAAAESAGPENAEPQDPLLNPASEEMNKTAPDLFQAKFETSKGDFVIEVHRDWSPNGADRFYNLVGNGYYDGVRFFRVLDGFMAQFGISGDPEASAIWRQRAIPDDSARASNTRGYVTYAMGGPNTRTTQVFINYADNSRLDGQGFAPFGLVVEGMDVVDGFYSEYGEAAPSGRGPNQTRIQAEGNGYLETEFPLLDHVERAYVVGEVEAD
jgi:cyclophilin family peptidyl-prolyl cis-trans isomerase